MFNLQQITYEPNNRCPKPNMLSVPAASKTTRSANRSVAWTATVSVVDQTRSYLNMFVETLDPQTRDAALVANEHCLRRFLKSDFDSVFHDFEGDGHVAPFDLGVLYEDEQGVMYDPSENPLESLMMYDPLPPHCRLEYFRCLSQIWEFA